MILDPFLVDGPAYISFSGGRTSGYMLWRVLQAHNGKLPPDVHVFFSNTGCELEGTLEFVAACANNFGVKIRWVEYRVTENDDPSYAEVDFRSASRHNEPFDIYLDHSERYTRNEGKDPYLPGPGGRYCTTELKIRVMKRLMLDLGYEHWTNVVGIRWDEPKRWRKVDRSCPKERWELEFPLVDAKVTKAEVLRFWETQPFDLGLKGDWEGNCDACHLKMPWKVAQVFQDHPQRAAWWLAREQRINKQFRSNGPSIAQLVALSKLPIVRECDEEELQCSTCTD